MSDRFIPTTDLVRDCYAQYINDYIATPEEGHKWFDRWLAAHDAEVYQRGREDAAKAVGAVPIAAAYYDMRGNSGEDMEYAIKRAIAAARGDGAK